ALLPSMRETKQRGCHRRHRARWVTFGARCGACASAMWQIGADVTRDRLPASGASTLVVHPKENSMAVSVKRITLWRADVENRPGVRAPTLEPLARAGADLRLVMGYRFPQTPEHSAIELYPVSGKKVTAAAQEAGLGEAKHIPCLL